MDRLGGSLRCGRRLGGEGRGRGMGGFLDVDCTRLERPLIEGNPRLAGCNDPDGFRKVLAHGWWVESLARIFEGLLIVYRLRSTVLR
jgi:hypothetical protein